MSGSLTNLLEDEVLNRYFRNTTTLAPAAVVYLALYSVAPGESGGGTELSGDGYTRTAITFGVPAGGVIANIVDVLFPTATPAAAVVAVEACSPSRSRRLPRLLQRRSSRWSTAS